MKPSSLVLWMNLGAVAIAAMPAGAQVNVAEGEVPPPGAEGGPRRALDEADRARWLAGREFFARNIFESEGLGPRPNAESCGACHKRPALGGAGGLVGRVATGGNNNKWWALYMEQRRSGEAQTRLELLTAIEKQAKEGQKAQAQPVAETTHTPSVLGLGLLESVYDDEMLVREDPTDRDSDGIRGVASRVEVGGVIRLGRFGFKAQLPTLTDFVRVACGGELGLTVPEDIGFGFLTDEDDVLDPEMTRKQVDDLVFFCRELAAPKRGGNGDQAEVLRGQAVFDAVRCAACHVPALQGPYGLVRAYTDLLLHDVVQDPGRVEKGVEPARFRTAPLWGIGKTAPYLHDGRAATLSGAIAAHAGEAKESRRRFDALPDSDREALLAFLRDL